MEKTFWASVTDTASVVPQFGQQGPCFPSPVVLIDPGLHLVYDPVLGLFIALVYLLIRNNFYYNIPLTQTPPYDAQKLRKGESQT